MRTPRDLLLTRHAAAQPKLDALRRHVVAEYVGVPAANQAPARPSFLEQLWMELFWSCRRAWLGLAAAWAVVLVLNLAARRRWIWPATIDRLPNFVSRSESKTVCVRSYWASARNKAPSLENPLPPARAARPHPLIRPHEP